MLLGLVQLFLLPPVFSNEEATRRAWITNYILISTILAGLVYIPFALFIFEAAITRIGLVIFTIAIALGTHYFLRRGYLQLTTWGFLGYVWGCITLGSFLLGGVYSLAVYYLFLITAAGLLGVRQLLVFCYLSILGTIVIWYAESLKLLTNSTYQDDANELWFSIVMNLGITTSLIYFFIRDINRNRQQIVQNSMALATAVTKQHRAQALASQVEKQLKTIFNASSMAIAISTTQGKPVMANRMFKLLLGYGQETLWTLRFYDFTHPEHQGEFASIVEQVLENGYATREQRYITRQGQTIWVRHNASLFPVEEHQDPLILSMIQDITQIKEAQTQKLQLTIEKERNDFLAEFISNMSHDFKTPLTVINNNLYLLGIKLAQLENLGDDIPQKAISKIQRQTELLDKYIRDIIMVSRLETLQKNSFVPMDLADCLHEAVEELAGTAEQKNITLRVEIPPSLPIQGIQQDLFRSFVNLIENAVYYTPIAGEVAIRCVPTPQEIELVVEDTGIGIAPEYQSRIFDRFYRAPNAREYTDKGTGLGLAIVKRVIEIHAGTIEVASTVGQGTQFHVRLPHNPIEAFVKQTDLGL